MDTRNKNPVLGTLLGFLNQPEKCDVKFNVHLGGDTWMPFWGHKLILSIWSPIFAAHFSEEENDESYSELDINDCPPTVFKHFLRFMYGSSEGISENKNNGKFLLDLYKLAELYQVEQLKKDCRKVLIAATVEFENVFQFLSAANYIDLEIVKLRCFELISNKTAEVIAVHDLNKITSFMVITILNLDTLSLFSEYDLLLWVFNWAESQRNKSPPTNPKEIIKPFLPFLNFTALKAEQFAALINKHKEFFDESDGFKIFLNICDPGPSCMPLPVWHNEAKSFRSYKTPNTEDSRLVLSENLLSNDTQNDTKPVEHSSSVNITADKHIDDPNDDAPTELANQSVKDSNQKSTILDDNSNSTVDKSSFKNEKIQEYRDAIDSLNSFDQVASFLSENLLLDQSPTGQAKDLNYYSLNDNSTDTDNSLMELDYSKLKRIKRKKIKKWYLLQSGKFVPHTDSIDSMNTDVQNLIETVWKENYFNSI